MTTINSDGVDLGMSRRLNEKNPKTTDFLSPIAGQLTQYSVSIDRGITSKQLIFSKCPYFRWTPVTEKAAFCTRPFSRFQIRKRTGKGAGYARLGR